jgi:hypothetical protein
MPVEELIQLEPHQVMEWIITGGYASEGDFYL